MILLILANTMAMATYTHDQSDAWLSFTHGLDYFFDAAFLLEMVLKLIGLGPRAYFKDRWNRLDAFLVIASISDQLMLLTSVFKNGALLERIFQFLRLLRLLRMLKLARYFQGLRSMLQKTAMSLVDIGPFAFLLFLFIYLFALIGRELFAYKAMLDEDD